MRFTTEVLLKGHDVVVDEVIELDAPEPHAWTDHDVHEGLRFVCLG